MSRRISFSFLLAFLITVSSPIFLVQHEHRSRSPVLNPQLNRTTSCSDGTHAGLSIGSFGEQDAAVCSCLGPSDLGDMICHGGTVSQSAARQTGQRG